jgi:hypothetical protein
MPSIWGVTRGARRGNITQASKERRVSINSSHKVASAGNIIDFFRSTKRKVITFGGFAELGYQHPQQFLEMARDTLSYLSPSVFTVNASTLLHATMLPGIADILRIAKDQGFRTSSIHPTAALATGSHSPSPFADDVFFIEDDSWGRISDSDGRATPALQLMLDVTDRFTAIGGGKYTAQELVAFRRHDKCANYYPALMNIAVADAWQNKVGAPPFDHRGEAHNVWNRICR